jgi:hypothetical protein
MAEEKEAEWLEIQKRAQLSPYRPPPVSVLKATEERRRLGIAPRGREYLSAGRRDVGTYSIQTRRTRDSCRIRVVENLEKDKTHTVGVWTGDPAVCDPKVREIAAVIHKVQAEKRGAAGVKSPPGPGGVGETLKPERYIVYSKRDSLTRKPIPLETARDVAKAISTVRHEDIIVKNTAGQVEDIYRRGGRVAPERPSPPMGRQFYTPPKTRPARDIRRELLDAAKRGDIETAARLTKELGEG